MPGDQVWLDGLRVVYELRTDDCTLSVDDQRRQPLTRRRAASIR